MKERVDVVWHLKNLFICYKYGEKEKFSKSLDILAPYLDTTLYGVLTDIERESLFLKRR